MKGLGSLPGSKISPGILGIQPTIQCKGEGLGVTPWVWESLSGSSDIPGFPHLLLLVLALVVTQEGFGASPPCPPAPALPTLWNLLLSAQTDLHLHRAGWGECRPSKLS